MAVFLYEVGNDTYRGIAGEYNQLDYDAPLSEFTISRNADGSVTVFHPTLGTDTLVNIDGLWSDADQSWYSIDDAIEQTDSPHIPSTPTGPSSNFDLDEYGVLRGTNSNDVMTDTADITSLYGGKGNDRLTGTAGEYSQAEYDGSASEYTFTQNVNGSVTITHPVWGTDTLKDIDGIWFQGEQTWYAIEDAIALTSDEPTPPPPQPIPTDFEVDDYGVLRGTKANDVMTDTADTNSLYGGQGNDKLIGTAGEYSQAEYDGSSSEYTFTQNANGSVTVTHPVWGTDTLTDIDGFWFQGEQAWYAIEELVTGETNVPTDATSPAEPNPPTDDNTGIEIDGVITGSNNVNDTLVGDAGDNVFFAGRGTDVILGGNGNDTLRVDGDILEWTFSANADGSITMTHPTWGENTLVGIENILSQRSGQTFTIDDAIASTDGLPRFRLDNDNVINGTNEDDTIQATADVQGFYGGTGNDVYFGTDNFEQVNYDGSRSEYNITQNNDGSITVDHPIWGTDTLNDIDALIFTGAEPGVGGGVSGPFEFISTDDLFA